jgi:hypothetical protein
MLTTVSFTSPAGRPEPSRRRPEMLGLYWNPTPDGAAAQCCRVRPNVAKIELLAFIFLYVHA